MKNTCSDWQFKNREIRIVGLRIRETMWGAGHIFHV